MLLKFQKQDGTTAELTLGTEPITLGRSPDADVPILDERASRTHCGIRLWDGEYYVKDLKSKNGTYVNNEKIEMSRIKPGDRVRIGNFIIQVEDPNKPGTDTLMGEVAGQMGEGKGFKTMLREIVEDVEESEQADKAAQEKEVIPAEAAAQQTVIRKKIKTVIKSKPKLEPQGEPEIEFDAPEPEAVEEPEAAPESEAAAEPPPPLPTAAEDNVPNKPKTIMLKNKPKRPVQIKINKKPQE